MDQELYTSVGAQIFHKVIAIVKENNLTHAECVTDKEPSTSVGAQIYLKVIAIVMENNSMYWANVVEVVPRI
jgi:hypothetical protein